MSKYLSVTELNVYLKQIVDSEELLHRICVVGEVSGLSLRGAHAYLTLKDENSELRACIFNYKKTVVPKNGDLILAFGSIGYYLKGGYLSFNIDIVEPYGKGLAALELAKLKEKLSRDGIFDESHKKEIPPFAENICVLTSKDGAVIHDITRTIRRSNELTNIDYFDVKVQGIGSADSIITALKYVDKLGYDAIIVARGGGSFEDLMSFNDERLVYAIYDAITPIVSAVGHETDVTLCDFVADMRVPTPTAAGELFAYDIKGIRETLGERITRAYESLVTKYRMRADECKGMVTALMNGTMTKNNELYSDIRVMRSELLHAMDGKVRGIEEYLVASLRVLSASNPTRILEKGFVEVKTRDGAIVSKISALKTDEEVVLRGADGSAVAKIMSVSEGKIYEEEF